MFWIPRSWLAAVLAVLPGASRLDNATYGICTACGERVAAERVFVFPESATCVSCQD